MILLASTSGASENGVAMIVTETLLVYTRVAIHALGDICDQKYVKCLMEYQDAKCSHKWAKLSTSPCMILDCFIFEVNTNYHH